MPCKVKWLYNCLQEVTKHMVSVVTVNLRSTQLTQTQMHLFGRKYKTYNFLDVHKHKTI